MNWRKYCTVHKKWSDHGRVQSIKWKQEKIHCLSVDVPEWNVENRKAHNQIYNGLKKVTVYINKKWHLKLCYKNKDINNHNKNKVKISKTLFTLIITLIRCTILTHLCLFFCHQLVGLSDFEFMYFGVLVSVEYLLKSWYFDRLRDTNERWIF